MAFLFLWTQKKFGKKIKNANPYWILLALAISILSHLSRARRWDLLLEPLGYKPSLRITFLAVMTGYFGNIFIPRGGEVLRCVVLNRADKVPMASSIATVVAERVIDLLCLGSLVLFSLFLEYDKFLALIEEGLKSKGTEPSFLSKYFIWFVAAGIIFVVLAIIFRNHIIILKIKKFYFPAFQRSLSKFHKTKT